VNTAPAPAPVPAPAATPIPDAVEKISSTPVNKTDLNFLKDAANAVLKGERISQLAVNKTARTEVRDLAQRITSEHQQAYQELKSVGMGNANLKLPTEGLTKEDQKSWDKLSDLSDEKFDREYVNVIISDLKKSVKLFEKEAKDGQLEALKTYATRTLPTLQAQLDAAQTLERDLKARM
jgi:putative membrane protein